MLLTHICTWDGEGFSLSQAFEKMSLFWPFLDQFHVSLHRSIPLPSHRSAFVYVKISLFHLLKSSWLKAKTAAKREKGELILSSVKEKPSLKTADLGQTLISFSSPNTFFKFFNLFFFSATTQSLEDKTCLLVKWVKCDRCPQRS